MKVFLTRKITPCASFSWKKTAALASRRLLLLLSGLVFCGVSLGGDYLAREDVKSFVNNLVAEQGMDRAWLEGLFQTAKRQKRVLDLIQRPYEKKPWPKYRKLFLTSDREQQGLKYWHQHKKLLDEIESDFGVPVPVILAIVGIETNYGRNTGSFPVFETLVTLGFDYPRRSKFFRKQLKALLVLAKDGKLDLGKLSGSYAGAMGISQFIPSSIQSYAVDFDKDGKIDLTNSTPDALASIANYLKMNGWKNGAPAAWPLKTKQPASLVNLDKQWLGGKKTVWLDKKDLTKKGILVENTGLGQRQFSLLAFDSGNEHPEYWLAFRNFYVIKTYNPSLLYAMAVHQLSQVLAARKAG